MSAPPRKQAPRLARPAVRYWKGKAPKGVDVDVDSDSDQEEPEQVLEEGDVDIGGDQDIVSEDEDGDVPAPTPAVQKAAAKAMNVALRDVNISKDGKVIVAGREESGRTAMEEEDEEEKPKLQFRPVFVPKRARVTVAERDAEDPEEIQRKREAEAEERRKQSHDLVAESIRRELAEKEKEDEIPDVDDTDGLDPEGEFEAWRLRELGRIKKEKEEELRLEEEREEIERRRALPEEQRLKEDLERAQKLRDEKPKGSQKFLQKYWHKGAFHQDAEILQKHDFTEATESTVDVSMLPQVMQVKNFGKRSRTKYTHLLDQDTTVSTGGFGGNAPVKAGGKSLEGGGCFLCGGPHLKKGMSVSTLSHFIQIGVVPQSLVLGKNATAAMVGIARGKNAIATVIRILVTAGETEMAGATDGPKGEIATEVVIITTVLVDVVHAHVHGPIPARGRLRYGRAVGMMIGDGGRDEGVRLGGQDQGQGRLIVFTPTSHFAAHLSRLILVSQSPLLNSSSFTMQIFMRDILFAVKEEDIKIALAEKLHRPPFPITPFTNFHIKLFRQQRGRGHRGIGILTLPSTEVGQQFLTLYGERETQVNNFWGARARNRGSTGISVRGRLVKFTASTQNVDQGLIDAVGSTPWVDPLRLRQEQAERARVSGPIDLSSFGFGRFCRDGVFSLEASYTGTVACNVDMRRIELDCHKPIRPPLPSNGQASSSPFDFTALLRELNDTGSDFSDAHWLDMDRDDNSDMMDHFSTSLTVSYSSNRVIALAQSNPRAPEHQIFIQSNLPPLFSSQIHGPFEVEDRVPPPPERLSAFNDEDFNVSSHASQGLRLVFKSRRDLDMFMERSRNLPSMPEHINRDVVVEQRNLYSEASLAALRFSLRSLDFELAFEVEKVVWEGLLDPTEVLPMHDSLRQLQRSSHDSETAAIFRYFLATLTDENRSPPRRDAKLSINQLLEQRYKRPLNDGLNVAGREYDFLGYSMSGLKQYSFYFVTPFTYLGTRLNAQRIRDQLGDFTKIINRPALLAARWSQAFSASDPSVTLEARQIIQRQDISSADGSVFTDGCSSISVDLGRQVWKSLRASQRIPRSPAAFQFRCGGAKGVLVQNPHLPGQTVVFRPSQTKFETEVRTLDIAATSSRPILAYLNHAFRTLQQRAIDEGQSIRRSFTQASKLFSQHGLGASFRLPSLFTNLRSSLKFDVDALPHLLIKTALAFATTHILREIKHRAHILIPGSYTLIGVSDEWDCLEEGEVYATVADSRTGLNLELTGRILITRSPQIHPGDVRFVTAVRRPQLAHLQNVVVFSCSLYPPKEYTVANTAEPGKYEAVPYKEVAWDCTVSDVADFVIDFIKSDLLGYISILHLRISDLKEEGPNCEDCLKLAEYASHAVDFNKRGQAVNFTELPRPPNPLKPDYLSGEGVNPSTLMADVYYPSRKILGMLYRSVPDEDYHPDQAELRQQQTGGAEIEDALASLSLRRLGLASLSDPIGEDLLEEMREILDAYTDQLMIIAKTHTISKRANAHLSEAELVSGTIQERYDPRKRREAVSAMNLQTGELVKAIRYEFQSPDYRPAADQEDEDDDESDDDEEDMAGDEERRRDKFGRAWAAWFVAEEALDEDASAFGPSSFGLLALGTILEVVKEAKNSM
ncbi:RdRP-domain-containing protein [Favolaschia claudopus]|uniref:RdRP-domain-containing protein n=1 Tax=Favolaschia claudopus TaxID=2862362 RepID=A0AAW0EHB1_9AGAR